MALSNRGPAIQASSKRGKHAGRRARESDAAADCGAVPAREGKGRKEGRKEVGAREGEAVGRARPPVRPCCCAIAHCIAGLGLGWRGRKRNSGGGRRAWVALPLELFALFWRPGVTDLRRLFGLLVLLDLVALESKVFCSFPRLRLAFLFIFFVES